MCGGVRRCRVADEKEGDEKEMRRGGGGRRRYM